MKAEEDEKDKSGIKGETGHRSKVEEFQWRPLTSSRHDADRFDTQTTLILRCDVQQVTL